MESIEPVILHALENYDFDVVAATTGPGLIGGLMIGALVAKTIAIAQNKPFFAINHLEAHILTPRLCFNNLTFPYFAVLTSGGNFLFVEILDVGKYNVLGQTLDDAAGEAFEKVAKMLGFDYPGGKSIENHARRGDHNRFHFTIPMQRQTGCDVSFSGLKTAVRMQIESMTKISEQDKCDIAASFQYVVVEMIMQQLAKAIKNSSHAVTKLVVAGGVAANLLLRDNLQNFATNIGATLYAPPIQYCTDNAAMIAWCAIEHIQKGYTPSSILTPITPRWSIRNI